VRLDDVLSELLWTDEIGGRFASVSSGSVSGAGLDLVVPLPLRFRTDLNALVSAARRMAGGFVVAKLVDPFDPTGGCNATPTEYSDVTDRLAEVRRWASKGLLVPEGAAGEAVNELSPDELPELSCA
jgi:hypothetical protein